jgi:nicotinamide mononucleotide transporter
MVMKKSIVISFFSIGSIFLLWASWRQVIPFTLTESFGFISGAAAVWLTALASVWNWPISIANAIFFGILFFDAKLYADMALQGVYVVLSILGWYWWLYGGEKRKTLPITHAAKSTGIKLLVFGCVALWLMTWYLSRIGGSVPFWDALTTVLSLIATYLLTKKHIENWYVWILADCIYIPLYAYKELYLTAVVYGVFLIMCIAGIKEWKRIYASASSNT